MNRKTTPIPEPIVELQRQLDQYRSTQSQRAKLPESLWQAATELAVQASRVGRNATLRSFTVSLGGAYARVRTDSDLVGQGGHTALLAAYLGTDQQVHDFRTLQDHHAPRTESELLFKGAVADDSRSVYSGLIHIRNGAHGAHAFQTNHNQQYQNGHTDSLQQSHSSPIYISIILSGNTDYPKQAVSRDVLEGISPPLCVVHGHWQSWTQQTAFDLHT